MIIDYWEEDGWSLMGIIDYLLLIICSGGREMKDDGGWTREDRGQKTEGRGRRTEDGSQENSLPEHQGAGNQVIRESGN